MPKGIYDRRASSWMPPPRVVDPPELVERIREVYGSGKTMRETALECRLCVPCHRTYDAARRRETGERTIPARLRGEENV